VLDEFIAAAQAVDIGHAGPSTATFRRRTSHGGYKVLKLLRRGADTQSGVAACGQSSVPIDLSRLSST
jgi:hypothetical protein